MASGQWANKMRASLLVGAWMHMLAVVMAFRHAPASLRLPPRPSAVCGLRGHAIESGSHAPHHRRVLVVGAGWGGLGAAWHLCQQEGVKVTLIDAAPKVGGLIRDGFATKNGKPCEAGMHGFWDEYHNIFKLVDEELQLKDVFTDYALQGQYSPRGLEAVWPIYRNQRQLPTGMGQALFTRFTNLPATELATAVPLVAAFSEMLTSEEAYDRFDRMSFEDLCKRMGVSRRLYDEVFEPMILTGLFAPGAQCSAAAALGMAYFFVLKSQTSFDVRWCRGNVGEKIFRPWVERMEALGVELRPNTRITDLLVDPANASKLRGVALSDGSEVTADEVILGIGCNAMRNLVRSSPTLASSSEEFAKMADLRGTDCMATRLWFDKVVDIPYSANPAWGFDKGVGMTFFDLRSIQEGTHDSEPGSVVEVDFYHAGKLLGMTDDAIVAKVHDNLGTMLPAFKSATVTDSAVVRIPGGVTWFFPGSHALLPQGRSGAFRNLHYVGDYVRSSHGSWSQEKAYVTGMQAANAVMDKRVCDITELKAAEPHVAAGSGVVAAVRTLLPFLPWIPDFLL